MKQTAVEFLWNRLYEIRIDLITKSISNDEASNQRTRVFEQAEEMFKQHIIDARVNGVAEGIDIGSNPITEDISKNHEFYYNETFKNK